MRQLELKAAARADLQHIYDYSAAEFGIAVAETYLAGLRNIFGKLLDFPMLGRVCLGVKPEMRVISYRRHRVFYQLTGDLILIVRILHDRRDERALLT